MYITTEGRKEGRKAALLAAWLTVVSSRGEREAPPANDKNHNNNILTLDKKDIKGMSDDFCCDVRQRREHSGVCDGRPPAGRQLLLTTTKGE